MFEFVWVSLCSCVLSVGLIVLVIIFSVVLLLGVECVCM